MQLQADLFVARWSRSAIFPTPSSAQIKIGVAEALTGNAAQYGVPIRKGFELAVSEINGSGGINGRRSSLSSRTSRVKKKKRSTFSRS